MMDSGNSTRAERVQAMIGIIAFEGYGREIDDLHEIIEVVYEIGTFRNEIEDAISIIKQKLNL